MSIHVQESVHLNIDVGRYLFYCTLYPALKATLPVIECHKVCYAIDEKQLLRLVGFYI